MADPIGATRKDTFKIDVMVEDVRTGNMMNLGIFDKKTGGQVDSEEFKYSPGAMGDPISLGGRQVVDNVVVSRLYRLVRDHDDLAQKLINGVGRARMQISQHALDLNGQAGTRPPIVWTGTLKRFTPPEVDSESSDGALFELEMTVEGQPVV